MVCLVVQKHVQKKSSKVVFSKGLAFCLSFSGNRGKTTSLLAHAPVVVAGTPYAKLHYSRCSRVSFLHLRRLGNNGHDDPLSSLCSLSSQPLQLAVSMVSVPSLLPHRQPRKNPFSESVSARSVSHRERQRVASSINHVELPPTSRTHPDSLQPSLVRLAELLPERSPAPADIQPSNASTARQQSSSSVAQTVGTTPIKPARPISNPNPMYPPDAVRQGLEGRVILSVTISFTGKVTRVTVAASCGHQLLDQAALGAVRRWRFSPATRDGKPVEWTARLPIRFRL